VIEESLAGGHVATVTRIGDTVRRTLPARAGFVHAVLGLLESRGWDGAPRSLGSDDQGRQMLSYVPGHVAWAAGQPADVTSDASLTRMAELVREFHDLTAGSALAAGQEVVCHNDLSPRNTVYRDGGNGLRPVAFIDWDIAAPGARLHDIAHACWQYLDLGPGITDPLAAGRGIRVICDGYGLADRSGLVDTILWWQDRCWRGILAGAAAADPAMTRLRDSGAAAEVEEAYHWVTAHRRELGQFHA
jgi:Phosphotransferase enzyme family